jgi:predicted RNase H-like HicB family nuclease
VIEKEMITMQTTRKKIKITVEKTDTGFSAFCGDYPVFTTGRTVPELVDNALEAVNLYFEDEGLEFTMIT